MIREGTGNLLDADVEALVNTVNCVGVMGKGIALQFRHAFPENYKLYRQACQREEVEPGRVLVVPTGRLTNPRYVINFPTKQHWREKSKIEYVRDGLDALLHEVRQRGIRSIALPPLGCGNGGLDWEMVRPLIERAFAQLPDVDVIVFAPGSAPAPASMPVRTERPNLTPRRAVFLAALERYRPIDPLEPAYRLSRLEVQKLAYFLQEAGEPLNLQFVAHHYGPYAEKLNHVLRDLEGHFIRGFGDRSSGAEIHLLPGATEEVAVVIAADALAQQRLARLVRLIDGFETPHGMELLASVHWVAHHEPLPVATAEAAIERVRGWNERKARVFQPAQIATAWGRLSGEGWLESQPSMPAS